jgi:hypothetical protein
VRGQQTAGPRGQQRAEKPARGSHICQTSGLSSAAMHRSQSTHQSVPPEHMGTTSRWGRERAHDIICEPLDPMGECLGVSHYTAVAGPFRRLPTLRCPATHRCSAKSESVTPLSFLQDTHCIYGVSRGVRIQYSTSAPDSCAVRHCCGGQGRGVQVEPSHYAD